MEQENKFLDTDDDTESPGAQTAEANPSEKVGFWQPLIVTTTIYSFLAFFFVASIGPSFAFLGLAFCIGIVAAMLQLTSLFAALGPGSYFARFCISQLCGLAFILFFLTGAFVSLRIAVDDTIPILVTWIIASAASQSIYVLIRMLFGWQLHLDIAKRTSNFTIRGLFLLTCFWAVSIAFSNLNRPDHEAAELDQLAVVLATSFVSAASTLFVGLPVCAATFLSKDIENGCGLLFGIAVLVSILAMLATVAFAPSGSFIYIGPPSFVLIGATMVLIWLPLAVSRGKGLVMTTFRQEKTLSDS